MLASRRSCRSVLCSLAMAAMLIGLGSATAQAQTRPAAPLPHQQTLSTNPFGLMFELINAEFERTMTPRTTWGVSGSYFGLSDLDYVNGNVMFRFYPQGTALRGFFIGSRTGVFRVDNDVDAGLFFGMGFEIGYNWLLGAEQNFDVSLGLGATRLFGGDLDGVSLVIPSIRLLNVGISF